MPWLPAGLQDLVKTVNDRQSRAGVVRLHANSLLLQSQADVHWLVGIGG